MRAQRDFRMVVQVCAHTAEHPAILFRHGITDRVWQIQNRGAGFDGNLANLAKIINVRAARVFCGKLHFAHVLAAITNHRADRFERLLARHVQLHLQMQIGGRKENVQTGEGGGFQRFDRGVNILLLRAGQRGNRHGRELPSLPPEPLPGRPWRKSGSRLQ